MKKILWVAKNSPLSSQRKELNRLFGECQIDVFLEDNPSAPRISAVFKKGYYDEMIVLAPLTICKILIDFGYKPLYCEMETVSKEQAEISIGSNGSSRHYKFVKFKRFEKIELVFSEISS